MQDALTDTWKLSNRARLLTRRTADIDLCTSDVELCSSAVRATCRMDCDVLRAKQVLSVLDVFGDLEIELRPSIAQPGHCKTIIRVRLHAHLVDLEPVAFALVG